MITLVGRSNVGKSTLFNRLLEERRALTSDIAGTTRDRNIAPLLWRGEMIPLVDTGGLDVPHQHEMEQDILRQTDVAIAKATVIVLVLDAGVGLLDADRAALRKLQRQKKPVLICWNKADTKAHADRALAIPLPSGYPAFAVSARSGLGCGDLLDGIFELLPKKRHAFTPAAVRLAIIGKPNVGKSSLLNALLGEQRVIVNPEAHTTREPQSSRLRYQGIDYEIVDTAGIRRPGRRSGLEAVSVEKSLRTLQQADVAFFVIDSSTRASKQDQTLGGAVADSGCAVVLVANKWDAVAKDSQTMPRVMRNLRAIFPMLNWAPIAFVSALEKIRVRDLLDLAKQLTQERARRISQTELDAFLHDILKKHLPARGKGTKHPVLYGIKQISTAPPAFELVLNDPTILHFSYPRFVENQLREYFGFVGVPLQIELTKALRKPAKT